MEHYVGVKEVCAFLGISRKQVYMLARNGVLPFGAKLGKCRRWRLSDIQAAIEAQAQKGVIA